MAQRLAKAKELYKQAGYSKDKPLTVTLKYNTDVVHKKVSTALASMLTRAFADQGLKVSMINEEWKVFISSRHAGDYQLARDGWQADYNDASSFLNLLVSNNPQNNNKYNNPKYDALILQAAKTTDLKKRQIIFQNAAKIGFEDYPVIAIYDWASTHLVKTYIGGYSGKNALDHMYSKYYFILE